jgi:L-seryl-tRNA(Ser) seleniumtransferase
LVVLSGDKLLGGPACGIIVGRKSLVQKISQHPLSAAVQIDKLRLAALAATLGRQNDLDTAERSIPLIGLLATSLENLQNRAQRLAPQLAATSIVGAEAVLTQSYLEGQAVPAHVRPSWGVALTPLKGSAEELAAALRGGMLPVIGRIEDQRLLLDLRSVLPRQDLQIAEVFEGLSKTSPPPAAAPELTPAD